jgi:predicted nucleic acid-binding Zn ribbon protein
MPIYDLFCSCGYSKDDTHLSVADYEKSVCPECKKKLQSRLYPAIVNFNGTGWTPRLTGSFRQISRPEMEYEVNEAHREDVIKRTRKFERERKIYVT